MREPLRRRRRITLTAPSVARLRHKGPSPSDRARAASEDGQDEARTPLCLRGLCDGLSERREAVRGGRIGREEEKDQREREREREGSDSRLRTEKKGKNRGQGTGEEER